MIPQTEVTECGLACIAMIANYYGYQIDLLTLRRQHSVSLKGSNLQDLIDLAGKFRLSSRALKLDLEELKLLKTPCILHWDLNHFVVLKKVQDDTVFIHDPALGIMKYKMSEVSEHFTGIALELMPTTDFEKRKDKTKLRLADLWKAVIGIKLPLIQILLVSFGLEIFEIISPLFMQLITDDVIVAKDMPLLHVLAIGFGLLTLVKALSSYVRSWVVIFLSNTLNIQLVANLMHHLFKLPLDFFEKRHIGDIVSRFGSVNSIQEKISTDFVMGIVDGFMVIVTLIMMSVYSVTLTSIVLIALVLYIVIRVALYPIMKYQTQESIIAAAKEQSIFMESIRAILPIKIFGKESQRENIWQNCYADKLNTGIRLSKLGLIYQLIVGTLFGIEQISITLLGAKMIMDNEGFSIGMLIAYLAYRQRFVSKAQSLIEKIVQYQLVKVHLERVADIALTAPEKNYAKMDAANKIVYGSIKVQNLSFRYSEQDQYIFQNINFEIKAGEILAIIGPSGCGKTTLMKVLLGLLVPSSGTILVDTVDITKTDIRTYRSQVAAVMQEDVLLSGSIAENICFFDPKPDFNLIYTCAMLASIHEEILQMTMGYQSLVGDMGTALSGGQKQRILLARALYFKPKILFLDEATSHLDTNNEDLINQNIKQLGITRVIIAHRQETISIANKVINLNDLIKINLSERA